MTRRCDRCRATYESGADLGGHDYCMTCYSQLRQEESKKRMDEEKRRQIQIDVKKQYIQQEYAAQGAARQQKVRDERANEQRRQDMVQVARLRLESEQLHKKKKWDDDKKKDEGTGGELRIFNPIGRKKKPTYAAAPKNQDEFAAYSARLVKREKINEKKKTTQPIKPIEQASLSLSIVAGLPVSLSVGQKQVQVSLIGKNVSTALMAVGIETTILDSQKSTIASKAEPRTSAIEPEGESKIKVLFDLPEDAAHGMLSFTAVLKENAVYIDKQAAQSNVVFLSSQVKSTMNLQYRCGSALFESGALLLIFKNVGECGGILEMSSFVTYFSQESIGKKATLVSRTKIKGGENGIRLSFSPAGAVVISRLELNLVGTDSNGKPYLLKRKFSEGEAPADEEKNEMEVPR